MSKKKKDGPEPKLSQDNDVEGEDGFLKDDKVQRFETSREENGEKSENKGSGGSYVFNISNAQNNVNEYDLIRFYLHEIADHSLLTREQEIHIAKEIETGKRIIAK